jgi:hypothetical protein
MATDWFKFKQQQADWKHAITLYDIYTKMLPTLTYAGPIKICKARIEELETRYPQLKQK